MIYQAAHLPDRVGMAIELQRGKDTLFAFITFKTRRISHDRARN